MYLGIEIGGTKLQLGLGAGDGVVTALWRGVVNAAEGGEGIRRQIVAAVPELLAKANLPAGALKGIGVGFGGPTDDATQTVIKSHHIAGWDGFPLRDWVSDLLGGLPAVICNDADVAGLAEALFGAGKGLSPIFYITVGTGIGGGLILDGQIYRGVGKGACEIGHLLVMDLSGERLVILEETSAGWGIEAMAEGFRLVHAWGADLVGPLTVKRLAEAARAGHPDAQALLGRAVERLALGIRQMITLLCPRRVIIGGGVSLIGDELFFDPIRRYQREHGMAAFAGLTDIVPAALGEEVVVHGALALARQKLGV